MKITLLPKTDLGKWATVLSIAFIILIFFKIQYSIHVPTFTIAALGLTGFVVGIIAIIKRDRFMGSFLSILVGLVIILWIIGEFTNPH
ncbi:hypothetical protein LGK95_02365 [Clostridium algoriphilum]|uniref:hypothetical protein n=1 Tax=Clostridium algoriphilum TaxID=198347 RepID=UPI001CF1A66E|nr:hypothetical protein [Clostridium algoriphilum]MCB2292383.1 hypothetical protein [Clostridium algoriphilum]